MRICIYGAASPSIDRSYITETEKLGRELAESGHSLVFGGGANGLMGAAARGVRAGGGHIIGVVPEFFFEESAEVIDPLCNEIIRTDTMRRRKQIMEEKADGFVVLPGGVGTFEEFFEILTLKQLCRHNKPIAVYNIHGYYDEIRVALEKAMEKKFIRESCKELYFISSNSAEILQYLERPTGPKRSLKVMKEG